MCPREFAGEAAVYRDDRVRSDPITHVTVHIFVRYVPAHGAIAVDSQWKSGGPEATGNRFHQKNLVHLDVFDLRLIFGVNVDGNTIRHGPVQNLVVDRDVKLLVLNRAPDRSDVGVTGCQIGV